MRSEPDALLGVVLDVSGSMQNSLGGRAHESRLNEVRQSLERVMARVRARAAAGEHAPADSRIRVFAYLFGTRVPGHEVLDVLPFIRTPERRTPAAEPAGSGFDELRKVARQYGRENWVGWAHGFMGQAEAAVLAGQLRRQPDKARELAGLLPSNAAMGAVKAGASFLGFETDVDRARKLVGGLIAQGRAPEQMESEFIQRTLARAGHEPPLALGELSEAWNAVARAGGLPDLDRHLFGRTPLCAALRAAADRFRQESGIVAPTRILFLLSDGEPTDGDPSHLAWEMRMEGIHVVSCFVTDRDLARPRVLYSAPPDDWPAAARLMFDLSSPVPEHGAFAHYLADHGWEVGPGSRMFVQVNHSGVLDDVLEALLALAEDRT
ncbi:MAG TPA: vWA domain-containing protein [Longimicrobium sp.]|nr:vWA domain-containing protein [Longimicrobium sp.]